MAKSVLSAMVGVGVFFCSLLPCICLFRASVSLFRRPGLSCDSTALNGVGDDSAMSTVTVRRNFLNSSECRSRFITRVGSRMAIICWSNYVLNKCLRLRTYLPSSAILSKSLKSRVASCRPCWSSSAVPM